LLELLAAVLLVCHQESHEQPIKDHIVGYGGPLPIARLEEIKMTTWRYPADHTSNDLLFSLTPARSGTHLNYKIIAQSREEVQDLENSPAVSMGPYLLESGQTQLLTTVSIYSERGESSEQVRLLYMNVPALLIWHAMGKRPTLIGTQHRPPRNALLTFGVPFSE
jgi:hypothetical protein